MPGGSPINLQPGEEILDTQGSVSLMTLLLKFVGGGAAEGAAGDSTGDSTGDSVAQ
jgi:phospholipid/cholesterol/gamma-HCH transport system substrate-binding protein